MYRVFLIGMRTLFYFALCAEFDLSKFEAVFQILASDHERVACDRMMKKALVFVRSHC